MTVGSHGERVLPQIYVSDRVKELIESQLVGYQLIECWDSEFSWQQKEAANASMCDQVDGTLRTTFNFEKAIKYVRKNVGELAYSGKWAIKADQNNNVWLGQLLLDGTYSWINPIYYPPSRISEYKFSLSYKMTNESHIICYTIQKGSTSLKG